jgi:hypothetical protein
MAKTMAAAAAAGAVVKGSAASTGGSGHGAGGRAESGGGGGGGGGGAGGKKMFKLFDDPRSWAIDYRTRWEMARRMKRVVKHGKLYMPGLCDQETVLGDLWNVWFLLTENGESPTDLVKLENLKRRARLTLVRWEERRVSRCLVRLPKLDLPVLPRRRTSRFAFTGLSTRYR